MGVGTSEVRRLSDWGKGEEVFLEDSPSSNAILSAISCSLKEASASSDFSFAISSSAMVFEYELCRET